MAETLTIRGTLRHRQFRGLWTSSGVYFIGNAMQTMAAAWMMVELAGSSFLAALWRKCVRPFPSLVPHCFLVGVPGRFQRQVVEDWRLRAQKVGIDPAIFPMQIVVGGEFATEDWRGAADSIANANIGGMPSAPRHLAKGLVFLLANHFVQACSAAYSRAVGKPRGNARSFGRVASQPRQANQMARGMALCAVR